MPAAPVMKPGGQEQNLCRAEHDNRHGIKRADMLPGLDQEIDLGNGDEGEGQKYRGFYDFFAFICLTKLTFRDLTPTLSFLSSFFTIGVLD